MSSEFEIHVKALVSDEISEKVVIDVTHSDLANSEIQASADVAQTESAHGSMNTSRKSTRITSLSLKAKESKCTNLEVMIMRLINAHTVVNQQFLSKLEEITENEQLVSFSAVLNDNVSEIVSLHNDHSLVYTVKNNFMENMYEKFLQDATFIKEQIERRQEALQNNLEEELLLQYEQELKKYEEIEKRMDDTIRSCVLANKEVSKQHSRVERNRDHTTLVVKETDRSQDQAYVNNRTQTPTTDHRTPIKYSKGPSTVVTGAMKIGDTRNGLDEINKDQTLLTEEEIEHSQDQAYVNNRTQTPTTDPRTPIKYSEGPPTVVTGGMKIRATNNGLDEINKDQILLTEEEIEHNQDQVYFSKRSHTPPTDSRSPIKYSEGPPTVVTGAMKIGDTHNLSDTRLDIIKQSTSCLINYFSASKLQPRKPIIFSGNLLEYEDWKFSLSSLIKKKDLTEVKKLHYIKLYMQEQTKDRFSEYFLRRNEGAYTKTKNQFKSRYRILTEVTTAFRCMYTELKEYLRKTKIVFKTNTPGVWERQIRSLRSILKGMSRKYAQWLSNSALRTALCKAAAMVNKRHLQTNSLCTPDEVKITPNQLMISNSTEFPRYTGIIEEDKTYEQRMHRKLQHMAEQFWKFWQTDYPKKITICPRWENTPPQVKIRDIVNIVDDNAARNYWKTGIITEAMVDAENLTVTLSNANLDRAGRPLNSMVMTNRPIQKIVVFM